MGHVIPLRKTDVHVDVTPAIDALTNAMVEAAMARAIAINDRQTEPGRVVAHLQVTLAPHFALALAAHPESYLSVRRVFSDDPAA